MSLDPLRRLCQRLGDPPAEPELAALDAAFAALPPERAGVARHLPRLLGPRPGAWWSECLVEEGRWHLSLFLLPAGERLPLHDHPGMHVWTRVLHGRLALRAFDWVTRDPPRARPAPELALDPTSPPVRATPELRNVHELQALAPTAVLDLFVPYYDRLRGRPCRYWEPGQAHPDGTRSLVLVREE